MFASDSLLRNMCREEMTLNIWKTEREIKEVPFCRQNDPQKALWRGQEINSEVKWTYRKNGRTQDV